MDPSHWKLYYNFECVRNVSLKQATLKCCNKGWGTSLIVYNVANQQSFLNTTVGLRKYVLSMVVCYPSYLPNEVRKVGKVARAICMMSHRRWDSSTSCPKTGGILMTFGPMLWSSFFHILLFQRWRCYCPQCIIGVYTYNKLQLKKSWFKFACVHYEKLQTIWWNDLEEESHDLALHFFSWKLVLILGQIRVRPTISVPSFVETVELQCFFQE